MSKSGHAVEQFQGGLNCSQAVLAAYAEDYGVELESALKIACGFGGGMGRMGHTCGAVTGAVMVLGLSECGPDPRASTAKGHTYGRVQEFLSRFQAMHSTTDCRDLLDCDISTPEGYAEATGQGLFQAKCPKFVEDAVEILEDLL